MEACSYDTFVSSSGEQNIPISAIFELTHRCNLRCTHCYLHDYTGRGELSPSEWLRVIDEFAELGGIWLSFTGGEIFLRSDIFDLIGHARDKGFALKLLTNALMLDDDKIARLADLWPAEVHVSVYSATPDLHDEITLLKGSWAKTVASCWKMREKGLAVTLKTPLMSCNFRDMAELQTLADAMGAKMRFDTDIMPKNDCSKGPLMHRLSDSELDELFMMPHMANKLPTPGMKAPSMESDLCGAARRTMAVTPIGNVQTCLTNPVAAGNVRDDSLFDIWNYSPMMVRYRNFRVADLTEECITCEHRAYCGRCSAMAGLEEGNYLGKSQWACRVSQSRKRAAEAKARGEAAPEPSPNKGFQFLGELVLK